MTHSGRTASSAQSSRVLQVRCDLASIIFDSSYLARMKLHGPIIENLDHAFASARRLRGHPVYKETLAYWDDLLQEARRARQDPDCTQIAMLDTAILRLELELAERAK